MFFNGKFFGVNSVLILTMLGGVFNIVPIRSELMPASASQTTLTFQEGVSGYSGTVDTFIRQPEPTVEFSSNLGLEWDGEVNSGQSDVEVAMIRFENIFGSAVGQIPAGTTIVSARLKYRVGSASSAQGDSANVYENLASWPENITWNTFGGEAGVQADEFANLITTAPASAANTEYTINVTASLERWVALGKLRCRRWPLPTPDECRELPG